MLKDNQKRKISATIRFLKADLNELEQLFAGSNDISYQKRKELMDLISLVGERSDALSAEFNLQKMAETASQKALGILSSLWVDLQEIKAVKLRSYGEVSPEVESDLDPEVDRIMDLISEMQRILRRRG
ncbi:MAG: hypothetical protein M0Z52_12395 [Actinomycetota bacterium]|nr:hypothetical protein [Actinomycetota bacterium]